MSLRFAFPPTKPAIRSSVHRFFLSFRPMSHASMHYKYLQISRAPFLIQSATTEVAGGATERDEDCGGLLFGRCLRSFAYTISPCVRAVHAVVAVTECCYRCTTWHPRIDLGTSRFDRMILKDEVLLFDTCSACFRVQLLD